MKLATLLLYMVDFVEGFDVGPGVGFGNFPRGTWESMMCEYGDWGVFRGVLPPGRQ